MHELADRFEAAREKTGMSMRDLSLKAHRGEARYRTMVVRMRTAKGARPTKEALDNVIKVLVSSGISEAWLRSGVGDMSDPDTPVMPNTRGTYGEAFEALLEDGVSVEKAYGAIGRVAIESPGVTGLAAYRLARRLVK